MEYTEESLKSNIIFRKGSHLTKDNFIGLKITSINDLKKATPHLKLPAMITSQVTQMKSIEPDVVRKKLDHYCRTCAGLKTPLVDIFSEKGKQMRLGQQIQHLEDINEQDSLSTQMCMDCICDMKMSYRFFMQIRKAQVKLNSIRNSNDSIIGLNKINIKRKVKSQIDHMSSFEEYSPIDNSSDFENCEIKVVSYDYNDSEEKDNYSDFNESFEEFDPDMYHENNDEKEVKTDVISNKIGDDANGTAYKYDESLQTYIKIQQNQLIEKENQTKSKVGTETFSNVPTESIPTKSVKSEISNQSLIKTSKNLKKKLYNNRGSSVSFASIHKKKAKKKIKKTNIDLKDLKIPKLDLQDPANIKTEEDGIMYITAKGSKPNEMLLIKVKKMDKLLEKKTDKRPGKKKEDLASIQKSFSHQDSSVNQKMTDIDEQIEQYKKKRVEILGNIANIGQEESIPQDLQPS